jgi:hypothetical protein
MDTFFTYLNPSTPRGAILLSIIAGIIVIGLQKIKTWTQLLISNFLLVRLSPSYTLDGYWFSYEIKDNEISIINYNKIIERKSRVYFHVWQYSNQEASNQYKRYYSEGIKKGNHLSTYFYSGDKSLPETGAFICKLEGQKLVGEYIQYSVDKETAEVVHSPTDYTLQRTTLPYKSRVRMFFSKPPFKTRKEAFEFLKSESAKIKWRQ